MLQKQMLPGKPWKLTQEAVTAGNALIEPKTLPSVIRATPQSLLHSVRETNKASLIAG
jgi:hypothetical protein